ncbi:ECF-type sigma factor [Haloferula sargassicola]|uniref:RNA polymerase sigma-70 ECF-like HTH domain-containing protein n=1 Tax=Haloferula sargassicola TaxID=490096 RepID=A0ABP9UNI5_9BACT
MGDRRREEEDAHVADDERTADSWQDGGLSSDELLPLVYDELRRLAAQRLNHEWGSNQTLQPTALVHEVWLRLGEPSADMWNSQGHFFGAAAQAMRRILVDRARQKSAAKRSPTPDFDYFENQWNESDEHILMIHECLGALEKTNPDAAEIVLLKFYGGLTTHEIADITDSSVRSVERRWMFAKAKLFKLIRRQLGETTEPES